jgi:hypothetical protein
MSHNLDNIPNPISKKKYCVKPRIDYLCKKQPIFGEKMSEKDDNKDKVNEPMANYAKQEISFFNSFEEMNESQYKYWLSLTPVQRLANHYKLITQIYKNEIEANKQSPSNTIIFRDEFPD